MWIIRLLFVTHLISDGMSEKIRDEEAARNFARYLDELAVNLYNEKAIANWNYETNITQHNRDAVVQAELRVAEFRADAARNASQFDWQSLQDERTKRLFSKILQIGSYTLKEADLEMLETLQADMKSVYSSAEVCRRPTHTASQCFKQAMYSEMQELMRTSRDWEDLLWAWRGWRDVRGRVYKQKYEQSVRLLNKAAVLQGFTSLTEMWQSKFEVDDLDGLVSALWEQVKPLYQQLHAYARRTLIAHYGKQHFPDTGHIPAHILGNMWAQSWNSLTDLLLPYPNTTFLDVTDALKYQDYTVERMFETADEFFTSLGLDPLPASFWERSMLVKPPDGRDVVCHASAWDFLKDDDVRIKMCTTVSAEDLNTIHHEMGHVQYYLQYKHQPVSFRRGANPGFHEALGDVMSLSVMTPEHLHEIGLLPRTTNDTAFDLNFLMRTALDKIAFLPFGLLVDRWRWQVFDGDVTGDEYNAAWWKLRCSLQGASPPVERTETDFDAGSKYHVAAGVPYIRYFISRILQFQFHKALCEASGYTGPLHRCDIYRSTEAGDKLKTMLQMGSSRPWPQALESITGQTHIDAAPLMEYFQPIIDWLREENSGYDVTWDDECPPGSMVSNAATIDNRYMLLILFAIGLNTVFTAAMI